ncbi:13221_t:CDS:1 [Cetraspora pellucida]|uniref:13221_t:CDS:1 n=1 Tax=Cetraspora pellucida TaxID=1433469 RepID=A0ACA9KY56_9GLOM|nr:13221_t:CDS:1 [Cetraspora pellucida]
MDIDNNEYIPDIEYASDIEYTSDTRQIFDTDTQSDTSSSIAIKKFKGKSTEEPSFKKICVNLINSVDPKKRPSYVWKYFEEERAEEGGTDDICKIIVTKKGVETECRRKYKHDGGTENMKLHLRSVHGIFGPNELQSNLDEKHQLTIAQMFKKVIPHSESKQLELKRITAEWLVTDSLPFNVVYGKRY